MEAVFYLGSKSWANSSVKIQRSAYGTGLTLINATVLAFLINKDLAKQVSFYNEKYFFCLSLGYHSRLKVLIGEY